MRTRLLIVGGGPVGLTLAMDLAWRGIDVAGIVAAAARRGLPLAVLDVRSREASKLYRHKLVLVRPDQHVAWRGDAEPADPPDLVDLVRGAARTSMAKSA
jgi:NADPH-dependent 2,4-dienoyl-CoA reductase/sulfur reductase-like enzyme